MIECPHTKVKLIVPNLETGMAVKMCETCGEVVGTEEIHHEDSGEYYFVLGGVPPSKVEHCLEWAFGKDYHSLPLLDIRHVWNQRHKDIFPISKTDAVWQALICIGKAYCLEVLETVKERPVIT